MWRFEAGLKLQGRLKPEMEAGFLTETRGPFSENTAGRDNPLWWSKRECTLESGRNPCEAGNDAGARLLETVYDLLEVKLWRPLPYECLLGGINQWAMVGAKVPAERLWKPESGERLKRELLSSRRHGVSAEREKNPGSVQVPSLGKVLGQNLEVGWSLKEDKW